MKIKIKRLESKAFYGDEEHSKYKYEGETLTGISFTKTDVIDIEFYGCLLDSTKVYKGFMEEVTFNDTHIEDSLFDRCDFHEVSFTSSSLNACKFKNATIYGAKFKDNCIITDTLFEDVFFKNCEINTTRFENCKFLHSHFENCVFNKDILVEGNKTIRFIKSFFTDTFFNKCDFYSYPPKSSTPTISFKHCRTDGMKFYGCTVDGLDKTDLKEAVFVDTHCSSTCVPTNLPTEKKAEEPKKTNPGILAKEIDDDDVWLGYGYYCQTPSVITKDKYKPEKSAKRGYLFSTTGLLCNGAT